MKTFTLSIFFISISAFATPFYELINFSSTRLRGIEEILQETNLSRESLSFAHCQVTTREDLFTEARNQNPTKNSLQVMNLKGDLFTYLGDGRLSPSPRRLDQFLKSAIKALKRLESIPESRELIQQLQFSPKPFIIKKGSNRYMPHNQGERPYTHGNEAGLISVLDERRPIVETYPMQNIGFGGFIFWNPATVASFVEVDYKKRKVDTDIILAHEMYHAYDGMRGLLDRRFVKADDLEFQPVAEYRAVRMENIVRRGLGYKYRRFYGDGGEQGKDLLDDKDETIIIPTPCINWLN